MPKRPKIIKAFYCKCPVYAVLLFIGWQYWYISRINLLFLFFKLGWGIVVLQCFVSFCCTAKRISYMCTYITSFLGFPPNLSPISFIQATTNNGAELPVYSTMTFISNNWKEMLLKPYHGTYFLSLFSESPLLTMYDKAWVLLLFLLTSLFPYAPLPSLPTWVPHSFIIFLSTVAMYYLASKSNKSKINAWINEVSNTSNEDTLKEKSRFPEVTKMIKSHYMIQMSLSTNTFFG